MGELENRGKKKVPSLKKRSSSRENENLLKVERRVASELPGRGLTHLNSLHRASFLRQAVKFRGQTLVLLCLTFPFSEELGSHRIDRSFASVFPDGDHPVERDLSTATDRSRNSRREESWTANRNEEGSELSNSSTSRYRAPSQDPCSGNYSSSSSGLYNAERTRTRDRLLFRRFHLLRIYLSIATGTNLLLAI